MLQMKLEWFTKDQSFPFFIQYGTHKDDEMFEHTHEDFTELVIVLSGKAINVVNGKDYPVKKGDVFVIKDEICHGYKSAQNFKICNIMFNDKIYENFTFDLKTIPGYNSLFLVEPQVLYSEVFKSSLVLNDKDFDEISKHLDYLMTEYYKNNPGYKALIIGRMLELFTLLSRLYDKQAKRIPIQLYAVIL